MQDVDEDLDGVLPLADVRVIEVGQLLAGPFCGQLLADFGAEVIKVEDPAKGDPMREWGYEKPDGISLWWPVIARNKKSVTCNLRTAKGQEMVRQLCAKSDILLENLRPGTLERWGLGYEALRQINPAIIMIRVTGYGQNGPYSSRAGFGAIGEAMGGLRYVTGDPSRPPSRMGISIGDSLAAVFAALGGLVALHSRQVTGHGQVVDSAIYEAVLAMMEALVPEYQLGGYIRERMGSILPGLAPSNIYPAADGQMILIAANQDTVFRRLAGAMGQPELAQDARFATHAARGSHQRELDELIGQWSVTMPARQLEDLLHAQGVPAGRIYRADDMLADPHFRARQAIVEVAHARFGRMAMQGVFPRLSATPGKVRWVGPTLGEHNREVYQELLGLGPEALAQLASESVI